MTKQQQNDARILREIRKATRAGKLWNAYGVMTLTAYRSLDTLRARGLICFVRTKAKRGYAATETK